jgi:hypothetical protein
MWRLWAVAVHTLRQCLRTKVAAVFIVLLAAALVLVSFAKGDGTLSGRIKNYLSWSTFFTAASLSLMTILLTTSSVSGDVRSRQIFSIATKPVARWQYVLGRWLGVVVLNLLLIAVCGAVIYGTAEHMRRGEALLTSTGRADDRRKVETEVFTSRQRVDPTQQREVADEVSRQIAQMKEDGSYDRLLESTVEAFRGNRRQAEEQILGEQTSRILGKYETAPSGGRLEWTFSGVETAGKGFAASGKVTLVASDKTGMVIQTDPAFIGRLVYMGPVWVKDVMGRARRMGTDKFQVQFAAGQAASGPISTVSAGDEVALRADPAIQFIYKAKPARRVNDEGTVPTYWEFENPSDHWVYWSQRDDLADTPETITVPARVVSADGRTIVRLRNVLPGQNAVTVRQGDVAILYRAGGFGANLARGMAMIFVQTAFLSALGVMAGTFASFAVACMLCFSLLPFQIARTFLLDAVGPFSHRGAPGFWVVVNRLVIQALSHVLPDFTSAFPGQSLVDGLCISWRSLGSSAFWTVCVQAVILLVVACVVFRKRELARVQI